MKYFIYLKNIKESELVSFFYERFKMKLDESNSTLFFNYAISLSDCTYEVKFNADYFKNDKNILGHFYANCFEEEATYTSISITGGKGTKSELIAEVANYIFMDLALNVKGCMVLVKSDGLQSDDLLFFNNERMQKLN